MPVSILDRVPLPNLRDYSAVSVLLVSMSVYHAFNVTSDPSWKSRNMTISAGDERTENQRDLPNIIFGNSTKFVGNPLSDVANYMLQEPLCVWTLINMTYCCLLILGRIIQHFVFGDLRVSERQQVKDKFWNFVFYKFIFVFGVINVQYMDEVVLWVAWFTALGFLTLLTQLCRDRFEYLSFSATSGGWAGARLGILLGVILALDGVLMSICVTIGVLGGGFNTFLFMAAECLLLAFRAMHVLFRYLMHIVDARGFVIEEDYLYPNNQRNETQERGEEEQDNEENNRQQNAMHSSPNASGSTRDRQVPVTHYGELVFELAVLILDLGHHVHMLLWSNIFLSMASLVICMQLRFLFHEIQRKVKKHRNYVWVLNHMERHYPMATAEELNQNSDNCAICWEKMNAARKLPCNHLFHNSCLSSWLQQDTSCPTCRMGLSLWPTLASSTDVPPQPRQPDHFFHFDGSRYVSWLPSFSVEVTHRIGPDPPATNSQIDAMARQVQQLFPHFPLSYLGRDLMVTHSVEVTIDNILDGRLVLPQRLVTIDDDSEVAPLSRISLPAQQATNGEAAAAPSQVLLRHSLSMLVDLINQPQQQTSNSSTPAGSNRDTPEPTTSNAESEDSHTPLGSKFSKCPHEREKLLEIKKKQILYMAKKKYLEKLASSKKQDVVLPPDLIGDVQDESSSSRDEQSTDKLYQSYDDPQPSTSGHQDCLLSSSGASTSSVDNLNT